jgi:sugar phosphate isomerase/epimerase
MPSRRDVLITLAASLAASPLASLRAAQAKPETKPQEIETPLTGTIGLQLWSLRKTLPTDLAGTLAKVRAMGFTVVEGAGLWKHTVADLRAAMDAAGLRCQSTHLTFERLSNDHNRAAAFAEAKAMGASWVVCPWIDRKGDAFTREDALKAAEVFNTCAKAAADADLKFAYHCHGYEFVPATDGTLFETLAKATDPKQVTFQIDVFHAQLGGADPAALIARYHDRVSSLHLKDLKIGYPAVGKGIATAPADADVPLGTGQVDMAEVLRTAIKAGVSQYYIEDESDDPLGHIPLSLTYLSRVKL